MKKILFLLIFLIVLIKPSFAQLYQYSSNVEIFENLSTHHTINLIFIDTQSEKLDLLIDKTASNFKINSTVDCETKNTVFGINVICNVTVLRERVNVLIEYDSNDYIKKMSNYYVFSDSYKIPLDAESIFVAVKLPEGTGLIKGNESLSPNNASIGSDGRKTIISWQKDDLKKDDTFEVSIAFEKIGDIQATFPFEIVLVTILITFSALGLFYQFYWKARNVKLILPVLKKDEKTIFNTIIKHGNGVNQKIIVKDSGYSKSKVSKVLNSLKERGLIKLERIGRSNKVHIEKNFEKKS
jgi:uncharacterized membrane protein